MRDLTDAVAAAIGSNLKAVAVFCEIDFADGPIYVWSGLGYISWNGHTWTGLGWLGQISAIPETTQVQAQNITLSLSGIPSNLVNEVIGQVRQQSTCYVWLAFFDSNNTLIPDPVPCFVGHLDVPTITDSGETCSITITAENPLIDLGRAPNRRYTDCDQQQDFPGDLGMSYVANLQAINLLWPNPGSP